MRFSTCSSSTRSSFNACEIAYVAYFNRARPHQGIGQQIPEQRGSSGSSEHTVGKVMAVPILAGLHHDYQRVA